MKSHRQICTVCKKSYKTLAALKRHSQSHSFQCFICKMEYPTAKELTRHLKKHILRQQWIDPKTVYLSNWCPEQLSEILEDQPLVLVENLDVKRINLNFAPSQRSSTDIGLANVKIEPNNLHTKEPPVNGQVKVEHEQGDQSTTVALASYEIDSSGDECQPMIELKFSEQCRQQTIFLNQTLHRNPSNLSPDGDSLMVEEKMDISTTYIEDVVDLSSESDVDTTELYHCYFCNEKFRSLNGLSKHVKTCEFCP